MAIWSKQSASRIWRDRLQFCKKRGFAKPAMQRSPRQLSFHPKIYAELLATDATGAGVALVKSAG